MLPGVQLTTPQTPDSLLPKLFGELRERYAERPGGYTRVLRTETKDTYSQAQSAVLELVDGPCDLRFAVTAAAIARDQQLGKEHNDLTVRNMNKVTKFRKDGESALNDMVEQIKGMNLTESAADDKPFWKYNEQPKKDWSKPWLSYKYLRPKKAEVEE